MCLRIPPKVYTLVGIELELFSRGWIYIASDPRKEWLIFAQTSGALQDPMANYLHVSKAKSVLADVAKRGGSTGGVQLKRLSFDSAVDFIEKEKLEYKCLVISTQNRECWKLKRVSP